MARTREFDPDQALDHAMGVFWQKGFSETSVDDLVEATGVSRYGLYGTFGDKRGLFEAALTRYAERVTATHQQRLRQPDASLPDLVAFWEEMREFSKTPEGRYGCMMACAASEMGPHDSVAAAIVDRFHEESYGWLVHIFRNAVRKGEVRPDLDPESAAHLVSVLHVGWATLIRGGGVDDDRFERVVSTLLDGFRN